MVRLMPSTRALRTWVRVRPSGAYISNQCRQASKVITCVAIIHRKYNAEKATRKLSPKRNEFQANRFTLHHTSELYDIGPVNIFFCNLLRATFPAAPGLIVVNKRCERRSPLSSPSDKVESLLQGP